MQIGRISACRVPLLIALCGFVGCGASLDADRADMGKPTTKVPTTLNDTDIQNNADSPYGTEPLIPAIQLDGWQSDDPHSIAVVSNDRTLPVSVELNQGIRAPDFTADPRATFHPHGQQVCASGCATSNHATAELKRPEFLRLLAESRTGPLDETNEALETLLYYGRQSDTFLEQLQPSSADSDHDTFLKQELQKTHVLVSFRVVDEKGIVRVEMKQTRVPLDRRHVFEMETHNVQPLVTSGTVKRVGLHHLWTRL